MTLVKAYTPIALAAALVAGVLTAIYLTAPILQSPEVRLNRRINEEIEKAQQMLFAYEPAGSRFLAAVEPAATRPAEVLPQDKWQDHLDYVDRESPFKDRLQRLQGRLGEMSRELGETRPRKPPTSSVDAYQQLEKQLERNENLIADALAIVQRAVSMSEQSGDQTITGASHPTATRLEAILIYHQADLLGRRAAAYREIADAQRAHFFGIRGAWRELETDIRSLEYDQPEEPPRQGREATAQPAPGAGRPHERTGKPGPVKKLLGRLFAVPGGGGQEPVAALPEEQPGDLEADKPPAQTAPSAPAPQAMPPTLAERTEQLHTRRGQVIAQINQAQTDVQRLTSRIENLEGNLEKARANAAKAEKRMLELEEAGVDPADPESLERFVEQYGAASKNHRQASREATILAKGAIRNARPDTDDENELLTAPLVPADPTREMEAEQGLSELQSELRAAQGRVKTLNALLAEIDRQIEEFGKQQQELARRMAGLGSAQAKLRDQAAQAARAAVAAVLEADRLETQAIDRIENAGRQAARRAERAASQQMDAARGLKDPASPNPRLNLITEARFIRGHAQATQGDLGYLLAMILGQQADDLTRHGSTLREAAEMGIRDEKDLLPEVAAGESVPASAFEPEAARQAAEQARADAIEAAKEAIEAYRKADEDLNRLWMLHSNIAAVHYLLANLTSGSEAETHRSNALREYELSIRDRPDRWEAEFYKGVMNGLTRTPP